ncbi:MAG: RpiB/LacA/LacB family sugar-phosphate isomerase [Bacillota bacterium]
MKIALINEKSQSGKNSLIEQVLRSAVEPMGHIVFNYGMYSKEGAHELGYVHVGILAAVLLNSGAADFIITGCGTGQGVLVACNAFPGVQCGFIADPVDAFLFSQINNGNAVSLPFAKGFGWAADLNLKNTFVSLFEHEAGVGYPPEDAETEKYYKRLMDKVKTVSHKDILTILEELDRDLVLTALGTERFREFFFENCRDGRIREKVKELMEQPG